MKRMLIIALAACFMLAMGTSLAFADSYDVTADYGKRVTEQGVCEEVGAVTITPEVGGDRFYDGQYIRMELLGDLEVCNAFTAVYQLADGVDQTYVGAAGPPGVDQFIVTGVVGQDYVTIQFGTFSSAAVADEPITYGHDDNSQLCVDLSGTLYTASDPLYQTLKATYSSSPGTHTFSGDLEIATVKSRTVLFQVCTKSEGTYVSANGYSDMYYKDELPQIELCYGSWSEDQNQVITDCGIDTAYGTEVCFRITDNDTGAFDPAERYHFTVGQLFTSKPGVGIDAVEVRNSSAGIVPLLTTIRYNSAGIPGAWASVDTAQMRVEFMGQGPGTYYIIMTLTYNSCIATPGAYVIDIMGGQVPCGGSFGFLDVQVADFVACMSTMQFSRVIPYGAETATSGWMNGIVFTNPNNFAITINCAIYEEDGDPYTATVNVDPMCMKVGLDTAVLTPMPAGADAVFGDESYAIYATGNGVFHVFMINFDLIQAQGYLAPLDYLVYGEE